jgi:hypothetical protein
MHVSAFQRLPTTATLTACNLEREAINKTNLPLVIKDRLLRKVEARSEQVTGRQAGSGLLPMA